ncbi:MAG: hypothetical protein P8181_13325, partial [bacterium]
MIEAPGTAINGQQLEVKMVTGPIDMNTGGQAFISDGSSVTVIDVVTGAGFSEDSILVSWPPGAEDDTLSTDQEFEITASARAEASTVDIHATLEFVSASGFNLIGPSQQQGPLDGGERVSATWRIRAPSNAGTGQFSVRFTGDDVNIPGFQDTLVTDTLDIRVIPKARLTLHARIAAPETATDGTVAIGSKFEIDAWVTNGSGRAGIETLPAPQVTINFSDAPEFRLVPGTAPLDQDFQLGDTVTWIVQAPQADVRSKVIRARISETFPPIDENSAQPAALAAAEVPIGISTDSTFVTADNISFDLGLDTKVVPRGTDSLSVLAVELENSAATANIARVDSFWVTLLDKFGNVVENPSRTLSSLYVKFDSQKISVEDASSNPMLIDIVNNTPGPKGIAIDPQAADSFVFYVGIKKNATLDEITIS